MSVFEILLSCVYAFLIVLAAILIVAFAYRPFKKARVKVGVFLALMLYGIEIYALFFSYEMPKALYPVSLLEYINSAMSVFFPTRGSYEKVSEYSSLFQFNYHLFHFLAYIYFALFALSLLARKFMNKWQQYFFYSERYLFFGSSESAKLLSKDVLAIPKKRLGCFFYISEKQQDDRELFEQLDGMGATVLYVNFENMKNRWLLRKISRYFFLDDDQDFNVKIALKTIDLIRKNKKSLQKNIHFYIRSDADRIDNFFANLPLQVELHIFNQSALMARSFINEYPMLDCSGIKINTDATVTGEFSLLLLGFGGVGYELLKKCASDAQYVGATFKATIFDVANNKKHKKHNIWLKEAFKTYNVQVNPAEIKSTESPEFHHWLHENILHYNRIIVALGDDDINIEIALILSKIMRNKLVINTKSSLFVHIYNSGKYSYYDDVVHSPITLFGSQEKIYAAKILIDEELDILAKNMNFIYSGESSVEKAWQKISVFNQESSRASALGIRNTLRLAGYKYVDKTDFTEDLSAEYLQTIQSQIEILAENEHRRWNAFHFMNGIHCWKMADISYEQLQKSNMKANQILLYNRHAALISYTDLPQLDAILDQYICQWNEEYNGNIKLVDNQQIDRDFIIKIPEILSKINKIIVKI